LATPVIAVTGVMYLIPSLALFAVLIPILGLGIKPAIVALVMYSLLVIVRNTFAGLNVVALSCWKQPPAWACPGGKGFGGSSFHCHCRS
jgi:osmoprotectant transport system permease protein